MKLTEEENKYYNKIFEQLDKQKKGILDINTAANFFTKSNLSQGILKNIWSISCKNNKGYMTRDEFFITLRLIALAQNNYSFSQKEIENNNPIPPLPKFFLPNIINNNQKEEINLNNINLEVGADEGGEGDESVYEIPESNIVIYKQYFENNKDSKDNYISTKKAIELWESTKMSFFTIKSVAESLKPLEKKGFLNLKEFQVAYHLLSISNCREIPKPLPNCLLKFLGRPLNKNKTNKNNSNFFKNFNNFNCSYNQIELNYKNNNTINGNAYNCNNNEKLRQNIPENKTELKKRETNINNNNDINERKFNSNEKEQIINYININENTNTKSKDNQTNNENNYNNVNIKENNEMIDDKNNLIIGNISNEIDINDNKKSNLRKIKSSNEYYIKNNINNQLNNTNNNNNGNLYQKIINRINVLEKKNEQNNSRIISLLSEIKSLQKEQNNINKEIYELKEELKKSINKKSRNMITKCYETEKTYENNSKKRITTDDDLINKSLYNDYRKNKLDINNNKKNENEPTQEQNKTAKNSFQRVKKRLILQKNENKEDIKKTIFAINNTYDYQKEKINSAQKMQMKKNNEMNNFLPSDTMDINNNNLNIKSVYSLKKMPLDEKDKLPENKIDFDNLDF